MDYCSASCSNGYRCLYKIYKEAKNCPCETCLVKVVCNAGCEHHGKFIMEEVKHDVLYTNFKYTDD